MSRGKAPILLLIALVVVVGAAVTIVLQITVVTPPPAVVAPLETGPGLHLSGTATYETPISVNLGQYVTYPMLAGLGKLGLTASADGWYYYVGSEVVTVLRKSTGNVTFVVPGVGNVDVVEINQTHAFVKGPLSGVIARKIRVGSWYVYHPVHAVYDQTIRGALTAYMNVKGLDRVAVFQPWQDYISFDGSRFTIWLDYVYSAGNVAPKATSVTINFNSFTPLVANTQVVANGRYMIDGDNYVLVSVWALYYYMPIVSDSVSLTITALE
jgi:hypothetical protein